MQRTTVRTTMAATAVVLAAAVAGCSTTAAEAGVDEGRSLRSSACGPAALSATLGGRDATALPPAPAGGGAALLAVVFVNEGRHSCFLQGWPTVRLAAEGVPFGPDALRIEAVPTPAVTLRPGKRAQVYIALHSGFDNYGCPVVSPDALAVTLPHTDRALDVGLPPRYLGAVCRATGDTLIGAEAVIPL